MAAPEGEVLLDAAGADDGSAIGEVQVVFQVPAEVFVILILEEGGEGDLDAAVLSIMGGWDSFYSERTVGSGRQERRG